MSSSHQDRMSSVPLMNLHERRNHSNDSPNVEQEWSDQEIEEFSRDPLESVLMQMRLWPQAITRQQCVQSSFFFSAISLCVGFLFAYVTFLFFCPPSLNCNFIDIQDKRVESKLQQFVDSENIKNYLGNLTLRSRPNAGTLPDYIIQQWQENGLDEVKIHQYSVLLSYPNEQNPNKIEICSGNEEIVRCEPVITISSQGNSNYSTIDFCPFSATGFKEANLVYVNYGEVKDYEALQKNHIEFKEKIVLARYGSTQPSVIVQIAESFGVVGILFYGDPKDEMIHRHSIGSTASILGDPLTPHFPSTDYSYRLKDNRTYLPKILVQPIRPTDAQLLFGLMDVIAPTQWKGSLKTTYKLESKQPFKLTVNNRLNQTVLHNVIGFIRGKYEPDRYVLVGSHRNERGVYTDDSLSGTAALLELTRIFGKLAKANWQPRRSIVFCSWADDDAIGSTEWTEEFGKLLSSRAIAYLNMDIIVQGHQSLHAVAVPSLKQLLYETAKKISNPNPEEQKAGRKTVFDSWLHSGRERYPRVHLPAARSDYTSFIHVLGIPVIDVCYMSAEQSDSTHLHAEAHEDIEYQKTIIQLVAEMTRSLADSAFLPFNLTKYAEFISTSFSDLSSQYKEKQQAFNTAFNFLQGAVKNLSTTVENFQNSLTKFDKTNPFNLRAINDQMMQFEKSFLEPAGLSCSNFLHSLYATNSSFVSTTVFPCVRNALDYQQDRIRQELSAMTFYITSAAKALLPNPL